MNAVDLAERRWLPDSMVRAAMRRSVGKRLRAAYPGDADVVVARQRQFVAALAAGPIATATQRFHRRHDGLPIAFYRSHLGPHLNHSSCLYATGRESLEGAEEAMLGTCGERAALADGQRILDVGCGHGAFTLWAAARYPRSTVLALARSTAEHDFVVAEAAQRGLRNVAVRTGNVADFAFDAADLRGGFDRIVSVETFGHVANYGALFAKLAPWLATDGRVFAQIVANRHVAHGFAGADAEDWTGRHFLTGGTMPSFDLFKRFDEDLEVDKRWWISGRHYERTANDWLRRLDESEGAIVPMFVTTYGADARLWFARWRMFYMAVAALFGYDDGSQWGIAHYRFERKGRGGIDD